MRVRLYALVATVVLAAAACGGGGDATGPTNTGNPGGTPGTPTPPVVQNSVSVGNNFFSPSDIQVAAGTTVTWTWGSDAITHNVTFGDGTSSGNKSAGASYSRTFATAGTFTYSCTLHGGMNGSVLVK